MLILWVGEFPEVTGADLDPKLKSILFHWVSVSMGAEVTMSGPEPPNLLRGMEMGGGGAEGWPRW